MSEQAGQQSIGQDIRTGVNMGKKAVKAAKSGIKMGKNAASAAKSVSKIASAAASGNFAGAAIEALKNPESAGKIIKAGIAIFLILSFIITLFLYALPTLIYEVLLSYFGELAEEWEQITYEGGGQVEWQGFIATLKVGAQAVEDFASTIWNGLTSLFTDDDGAQTNDEGEQDQSMISEDGHELRVNQEEAAEKATLDDKIKAARSKVRARISEVKEGIEAEEEAIKSVVQERHPGITLQEGDTVKVNVHIAGNNVELKKETAVKLLALYSAQTGANLDDVKVSELLRWMGYLKGNTTSYFDMPEYGIKVPINQWTGECLPQYLYEQRKQEIFKYGSAKTDFSKYQFPAVDLLIEVNYPKPDEVPVTKVKDVKRVEKDDDGKEHEVHDHYEYEYTVDISINPRPIDELVKIVGLWEGSLGGEES